MTTTKSYTLAIMHIYPQLVPFQDFSVFQDATGTQTVKWNNNNTQPTQAQLDSAWFEVLKKQKKDELDAKCDAIIMSGFTSSALGTAHTYPSDFQAMVFFNATINRFNNDSTFTTANQKTVDAGYLAHTKTQFIQVFNDGHAFGESQIAHLNSLKAQVDAITYSSDPTTQATNQSNLDAITW